jgi:hypothetical protein
LNGNDLAFARRVARQMLDPRKKEHRALYQRLVQRLAAAKQYATAWDVYRTPGIAAPEAPDVPIRNPGFEVPEDGSAFDWTFAQDSELWASRDKRPGGKGSVLRLTAYNGRAGEVAYQILHLKPGHHRLHLQAGDVPAKRYEWPEISVACTGDGGAKLLALGPQSAGRGPFALSAAFDVPRTCDFQRIAMRVAGEGQQPDSAPWVDDVQID